MTDAILTQEETVVLKALRENIESVLMGDGPALPGSWEGVYLPDAIAALPEIYEDSWVLALDTLAEKGLFEYDLSDEREDYGIVKMPFRLDIVFY